MANPTSNFGWQMPTNTDLVKDLPADFEVFGQAVDTDLADLKGGTTGQVLSKTSGTDLDFTWITPTDQTPLTTKGDLFGYSTADARIPVGTDGQILTADSSETLGVKWATPGGAGSNWSLLNAGGTSLSGAQTVTISGISGKDKIMVLINSASVTSGSQVPVGVRLNTDTGANYIQYGTYIDAATTYSCDFIYRFAGATSDNYIWVAKTSASSTASVSGYATFSGCNSSGVKEFHSAGGVNRAGACSHQAYITGGYYAGTSTISSVSVYNKDNTFSGGTVYVYASA